ncbi:MAG: hypothetical protein EXR61_06295 [Chloroflexi bacterium]|nr:hypothetical protein [Chloroflexota bacterium]
MQNPRRLLMTLAAAALVVGACAPIADQSASPTPAKTPDIRRSKLDIAYTALTENDVHKVSSRKVLTDALEAVRTSAKQKGWKEDVATPEFQDVSEPVLADFRKFADAVSAIAAKTPGLSPDEIGDLVLRSYTRSSPDCHTYYVPKRSAVPGSGVQAALPPDSPSPRADEAGLEFRLLPEGIGYFKWREFVRNGTYDVTAEVKKGLDALLAQGAKAWLFDLRGNVGGDPPQAMASWFLNGEPTLRFETRTGSAGTQSGIKDLRLPEAYQLPLAIILNRSGGSSPEHLALALKENKRAIIVGQRSVGCLGSVSPLNLSDGSFFAVVGTEMVGAITGSRYNNVGIPPDVPADDANAIPTAVKILQAEIAKRK